MKSRYYLGGFIVLGLIIILGLIGVNHKFSKSMLDKEKIINNFEIQSARINCKTIKLKVYEDKTYKVIHGYEEDNKEVISTGSFNYDVTKIMKNNHKYKNDHGPYYLISEDGIEYEVYDNNEYLIEFLDEIDIDLDTCLEFNY